MSIPNSLPPHPKPHIDFDRDQLTKERMSESFVDEISPPNQPSLQDEAQNLIKIFKKQIPPPQK